MLARSSTLVVSMHVLPDDQPDIPDRMLLACQIRTGRTLEVEDSPYWFAPPARSVSVAGNLVGYAEQEENDGVSAGDDHTLLVIADVTHRASRLFSYPGVIELLPDDGLQRVGSLAIDRDRHIAWIQCPADVPIATQGTATGSVRPNCVHPGSQDTVKLLVHPANRVGVAKDALTLASGTDIDPRSVRLTAKRVIWTQAGARHSARLPQRTAKRTGSANSH